MNDYDTADDDLQRLGLVLRRRVGGPNAGWRLQVSTDHGQTVIRKNSTTQAVPRSLADVLTGSGAARS